MGCLLVDSDEEVYCKKCKILTSMTRSRSVIYKNSCDPTNDVVKINFTVCNDGCDDPKDLRIAISTANCDVDLLSYSADQGFSVPIYKENGIYHPNTPGIKGYEFDPYYHLNEECHDFEFTFRVNSCENEGNFWPRIFVNGEQFNSTQLQIRNVNPIVIGSNNTNTYLSELRNQQIGSFHQMTGDCNGGQAYWFNLKINGTFIIDEDIKFLNNIFEMAEDAKIIVTNDATVCFEGSTFYSCSGLWLGIEAQNGSAVLVSECTMEDAEHALIYEPYSYYRIYQNNFINNKTGVWMKGNGDVTGYPFPAPGHSFALNSFTSDRDLKASYEIFQGHFTSKAFAGLKLTNHRYRFIVPSSNSFEHMLNGIHATSSSIQLDNPKFKEIKAPFAIVPPPFTGKSSASMGVAVHLTLSSDLKYNGGGHGSLDIENCDIGVVAHRGSVLEMENVYIVNTGTSVKLQHILGGIQIIRNCFFDNYESGIDLYFANPFKLDITDNKFVGLTNSHVAVRAQDFMLSSSFPDKVIENNHVILHSTSTGLDLNGSKGYVVNSNYFQFADGNGILSKGINLGNSESNNFNCNTFTTLEPGSDDIQFFNGLGMRIDHSPYNTYKCNVHSLNSHTWNINGSCAGSKFTGNSSIYHAMGIYMTGQTTIGPQLKRVNEWWDPYDPNDPNAVVVDAFFETDNIDLIAESRFETRTESQYIPNWRTLVSDKDNPQNGPWFTTTSGPFEECVESTCDVFDPNFSGEWTRLDSLLSTRDRNVLPDFRDGTWWNTQWHLYDRINRNYYNVLPAEALTFKDSIADSDMGAIYDAVALLRGIYTVDSLASQARYDLYQITGVMTNLDQQINNTPDSLTSTLTDLQNQRDSAYQLSTQAYTLDSTMTGNDPQAVSQTVQQALSLLPSTSTELPVLNMVQALQHWGELITTTQHPGEAVRLSLISIAMQCTNDGGMGVHLARSLLGAWGIQINEDPSCDQSAEPRSSLYHDSLSVGNQLKLVPNPAQTFVRVSTEGENLMTEIRVYNTQGVLVLNRTISPTYKYDLEINDLAPGVYIVQALDESLVRHHARLACVR
jgi:hypothetical protein